MKSKDPDVAVIRKEIIRLSKRIERFQQKYEQAKTADRKKNLAFTIDDIKITIGWHLRECKDYEKAIAVYQSMSWEIYGEYKYRGICEVLLDMDCHDEARQLLKKGLQSFPESFFLLMRIGQVCQHQGDYVDALMYFKQALKNCPGHMQALHHKAGILIDLGYYEDSLSILRELLKKDPDHGPYLVDAGYCTQKMGYPEEAVEYYKKALDCGYVSDFLYGVLACAYMDMGFEHDALEIAQEGIREFPDEPGMYEILGECYFAYGWIDDAKSVLQEGLKKFPDDEGLQEALNRIEDETNDPDNNKKPPLLGIALLLSLILKHSKKKK